ncbi:2,4-dienoyl-CoA reductase-like NADH-dependent reductase (Old Yellow Enzyme family) [Symbiobacterium terraclitae]|uniref:2,4-dienoyl-CoA reductase-like NADH-dependent reductase (Old Yellow Enzyme family) n=1 Tax=Symbiobacterium terraclitae TaxID=557451 RepID=A0ABS4JP89_9FIRM|nr:NADPH dehydrogenase NamA [Symbiobacterium terraclitae]MBP2017320.1 2,4-dienoyl-CoA reductase-like NADH-dependent reductase (Old Yellow Enzyme family) [Symbiobacterium terraclitae]
MPHLFEPLSQRSLTLRNRIVMSPMCMYVAGTDGVATDWHLVHYGTRAMGGVGLIITEATAVEPRGRISEGDLGIWNDAQAEALARIARFVHERGAAFSIQLAHAGRKAWTFHKGRGPEPAVAPSAVPFDEDWVTPQELDRAGIDRVVAAFGAAARRAGELGCDSVEIHAAHGYLLHETLSPLTNRRTDEYGGTLENRARLLKRVFEAVRAAFPADRPVWVRISATDWVEGGWDIAESVELARWMKEWGVDLVDVSTGGNSPRQRIPAIGPGYQVAFAERIRREAGIPTGAVGLITVPEQADAILRSGQADVVLLGRELLRNPYFPLAAAHRLGQEMEWPAPYVRGKFPR